MAYEWMQADGTEVRLSELARAIGVDYSTIYLWAKVGRGPKKVKLPVVQHPHGLASSMEAYKLFLNRLGESVEMSGS